MAGSTLENCCVYVCGNNCWCSSVNATTTTQVNLLKICSSSLNSLSFVLTVRAYFPKLYAKSVFNAAKESVYMCLCAGYYSTSHVGVWLMRLWSKGCEHRCPGFGTEAQIQIWEVHLFFSFFFPWHPPALHFSFKRTIKLEERTADKTPKYWINTWIDVKKGM